MSADDGHTSSEKAFAFLNFAPAAFLTRQSRASLLNAAYEIDPSKDNSPAREWLARIAKENDTFGPLVRQPLLSAVSNAIMLSTSVQITDAKRLNSLAKPPKDTDPSQSASKTTLKLLELAYL